ncbi:DUF350 domain-containing protein [Aquifex pyrophilus]
MSLILLILWIILSKYIYDLVFFRNVKVEDEIFSRGNNAVGISFAGFFVSLSFVLYMTYSPESPLKELFTLLFITLLLFSGVYLFDLLFLRKIDLKEEILKGNVSAGITQAFYFLSVGLILSGAYWMLDSILLTLLYSVIYTFLGMLFLYITTLIFSRILSLDFQEEVRKGNVSASLLLGMISFSVSLVVFNAISGEFVGNLLSDILTTSLYFLISQVIMVILYLLFEYVIFRKIILSSAVLENNLSASLTLGGVFLASALLTLIVVG